MRIDGVYDLRTLQALKDLEIRDFSFDFRPLSFNFLQQYKFMEMMEYLKNDNHLSQCQVTCHFANETKDTVQKIKNDFCELYPKDQLLLEFSDALEPSYYKDIDFDFLWHYGPVDEAREIVKLPTLRGIVLSYSFLAQLHEQGVLDSFYNNFYQLIRYKVHTPDFKVVLQADWNADFFPSLFDFFDFHLLSMPINDKIEVCYRNVDIDRASKNIHFYKQFQF